MLGRPFLQSGEGLTLGELLATARAVEADLLTFNFARITRDEAGLAQHGLERCIVID
jgi:hypothetical protein